MIRLVLFVFLLSTFGFLNAQVGINNDNSDPDASAMLDVKSDSKGMLVPGMSSSQRTQISNAATGLLVFDTDTESFWFKDSNVWVELVSGNVAALADADGDTKIQVEESVDEDVIRFDIAGEEKWRMENSTLIPNNITRGIYIGKNAGITDTVLLASDDQHYNIFIGEEAGKFNSTGEFNTAIGFRSFESNMTSGGNTALGSNTLRDHTGGGNNVAVGSQALTFNTIGTGNKAIDVRSLRRKVEGDHNTAIGAFF